MPISRFPLTSQPIKINLDGSIFGWLWEGGKGKAYHNRDKHRSTRTIVILSTRVSVINREMERKGGCGGEGEES